MKNRKSLLVGFLIVGVSVTILALSMQVRPEQNVKPAATVLGNASEVTPLRSFSLGEFLPQIQMADRNTSQFPKPISGGVIPHHTVAGKYIADFFRRLAKQHPKTIILVGPNHLEKGEYPVLTSLNGWETPSGIVQPDQVLLKKLLDERVTIIDTPVVSEDQAIAAVMPYLHHYMPETRVVPLLLSNYVGEKEIHNLAIALQRNATNEVVYVASVDFSHYLLPEEAEKKDRETLNLLREGDYKRILPLTSDHMDSPASVVLLMQLMEERDTTKMEILFHSNSAYILNDMTTPTTSYFVITYAQ